MSTKISSRKLTLAGIIGVVLGQLQLPPGLVEFLKQVLGALSSSY